jgi:pimeloyl-ACP methyl ester carboxylesterase
VGRLDVSIRRRVPLARSQAPGHGDSRALSWKSLDAAERVAALVESRALNGRAHLVGLSLGGEVGYVLMTRHSSRVERAIIDGAALVPSRVATVEGWRIHDLVPAPALGHPKDGPASSCAA